MIEVKVTIRTCAGVAHDVRADVGKDGPGRYQVEWCDRPSLSLLCLTGVQLHYLRRRCEEAYDLIEREREALGIADLLDDSASVFNSDRDSRFLEVA